MENVDLKKKMSFIPTEIFDERTLYVPSPPPLNSNFTSVTRATAAVTTANR